MRVRPRCPSRAVTALLLVTCACGGEADPVGLGPGTGSETDPGSVACEPSPDPSGPFPTLPRRADPRAVTSGDVPHVQLNPGSTAELIAELFDQIFSLPILENRPTIIGMAGTRAIWLTESVEITRPECVVAGREFAHIHLDGSLHGVLPHERIPDAVAAGWVELHPFAGSTSGFEAFVMLFAPRSSDEVVVIFDLVVESLNFVTGG